MFLCSLFVIFQVGVAVIDIMTGMYAANAAISALFGRVANGMRGQHIDVSLLYALCYLFVRCQVGIFE